MEVIYQAIGTAIGVLMFIGLLQGVSFIITKAIDISKPKQNRQNNQRNSATDTKDNEDIHNYIDRLVKSYGIQEPVKHQALKILFDNHLYAECVLEIMRKMGLNNRVKLISYSYFKYPGNNGTVAFVTIPSNAPPFYSSSFNNLKIQVSIRDDLKKKYETFVYVIAHELSHIVLRGMKHPLKDSEIATDLFVMIRGFNEIMEKGRTSTDESYGYLNSVTFKSAKDYIEKLHKEKEQDISYQEFKRKFNLS